MSTRKHLAAFAALLSPALLFATSINVTFDAALTNTMGWTYYQGFEFVKSQSKYGFKAAYNGNDQITSPTFNFAITSVVIHAEKASASTGKKMSIRATSGAASTDPFELVNGIVPTDQIVFTSEVSWAQSDCVRSFALLSTGGTGNLYLESAVISGVPLIEAPTNLQADDSKGTRCRLSWANPVNAVSNKIEVSEVVRKVVYGTMLAEYDFMAFTNKSSSVPEHYDKQSLQVNDYPSFSGTNIYKAASNSTGVVQISNGKSQGYLKYDFSAIRDSLDEAADISLHISAKKHDTDISTINWKLLVAQINNNNTTNKTDEIDLTGDFPSSPFTIQVVQPNSCRAIVMRPSDETQGNRRILIDYLAFINVGPTTICETNLVITAFATNSTTYCVRELNPRTQYIASATAFDADGNESEPSEPISFMTNGAELPLVIRLQ